MNILSANVGCHKMVFRLFSFSACQPAKTEVSYNTTEGEIRLEKDSALYQLMDTRMNGVMNGIVRSDGEYQAILRESDIYSGELDRMDLSKEIRLLIDRYVSEQNALGSRYGMLTNPAWLFRLQGHVLREMPANRSKRNDHGTVTAKCRTGRLRSI
jgi:hypothetical protein